MGSSGCPGHLPPPQKLPAWPSSGTPVPATLPSVPQPSGARTVNWFCFKDKGLTFFFFLKAFSFLEFPRSGSRKQRWLLGQSQAFFIQTWISLPNLHTPGHRERAPGSSRSQESPGWGLEPRLAEGRVWGSVSPPGQGGSVGSALRRLPCPPASWARQPGSPCFPHQVAGRDLVPTPWLWEQAQAVLELRAGLQAS